MPRSKHGIVASASKPANGGLPRCRWVQSVYVHPEHRKQGHYRALYSHVRQLAKDSGASGIRLYADNDNARANQTVRCWCLLADENIQSRVPLLPEELGCE